MSAIYGVIQKNGSPVTPAMAEAMRHTMEHRAIDGHDAWMQEQVLMGHCRLDMIVGAGQKSGLIITDDIILTADVRLDNREYLLQQTGASRGSADEQLLLYAYLEWEEACVHHLKGEYAFCIWHRHKRTVFIATDHIGHRPLYYADSPDQFIFCSELKGVLAVKPGPHVFNPLSLIAYHFRRNDPGVTYTKGIHALCAGSQLIISENKIKISKYWQPEPGRYHFRKPQEWTDCLRELLSAAIRNRLRTDRPVGITLSGGLDSSSITCILAKELQAMNKPLYAFSSVAPAGSGEKDEKEQIAIMGRHFPNLIQTNVYGYDRGPFNDTIDAFEADEVFPNIFFYMDHAILEAAREKRVGVLFTGFGGDHWVSWKGNPVIYNMINKGNLRQAWRLIKTFSATERRHPLHIIKREYTAQTSWYRALRAHRARHSGSGYVQPSFSRAYDASLDLSPVRDIRSHMSANIASGRTGLIPAMLANRNESYGMQSAVPLLDRSILEFMMDVPQQLFVQGGYKRSLLRHAMKDVLPPQILWRKDKGRYSPDFMDRIEAGQPFIEELLSSSAYDTAFRYYLTKEHFRKPCVKGEQPMIRLAQGVISVMVIAHLQKKGYVFDDNFS